MKYDILIVPLSDEDGGGYLGIVPDLQGCMSDGGTRVEAIANTEDAIAEVIDLHERTGRVIPEPGTAANKARKQYHALTSALKELSKFAEEASTEVVELRATLQALLEELRSNGMWISPDAVRSASVAKQKALCH